jgi:nuclease S1
MRSLSLALLTLLALCGNAWAWGDHGHKVVCEIAFRLAEPETRARIRRLIRNDPAFDFFSDSCTWADHPRKRPSEHFINLARNSGGLGSDPCPLADKCLLTAIENDMAVLKSAASRAVDKLTALKFLGHWVGDLHQPLHVSFQDDRGGNEIDVTGECRGELHSAWDTCLVLKAVGEDVSEAAGALIESITPTMMEVWTATEPLDWANESFASAKDAKTRYCVQQPNSCDLQPGTVTIDSIYVAESTPVIRERLQKAGVRLAYLLDEALGN